MSGILKNIIFYNKRGQSDTIIHNYKSKHNINKLREIEFTVIYNDKT